MDSVNTNFNYSLDIGLDASYINFGDSSIGNGQVEFNNYSYPVSRI